MAKQEESQTKLIAMRGLRARGKIYATVGELLWAGLGLFWSRPESTRAAAEALWEEQKEKEEDEDEEKRKEEKKKKKEKEKKKEKKRKEKNVGEMREDGKRREREEMREDGRRECTAVGCLSVRTAWMALLEALALPPESTVLMSAVTIRDMALLARSAGCLVAPLDVHRQSMEPLSPDEVRVPNGTRVVVLAHIFGCRISERVIKEWALYCRPRSIVLVEDCAQIFEGLHGYRGSQWADVSLFSFGSIKTMTALGGCLGRIRDEKLRRRWIQVRDSFPVASSWSFSLRCFKYCVIIILQMFPLLLAAAAYILELLGGSYDALLTQSLRGFSGKDALMRIRCQAPPEMWRLLTYKLRHRDGSSEVRERKRLVARFMSRLDSRIEVPGWNSMTTGWLTPILAANSGQLIRILRNRGGFDVTNGTSQLSFLAATKPDHLPALEARHVWMHVLYLPIYPPMSNAEVDRLAEMVNQYAVPAPASPMPVTRSQLLSKLMDDSFDVLVVGGGVSGLGAARAAALEGFRVALVEKNDFASQSSGSSSRLLHGGFRYVESLQLGLVRRLCYERNEMAKLNPHLVKPTVFQLPLFKEHGNRSLKISFGLYLYHLCGRFFRHVHRRIRKPVLLKSDGLVECFEYDGDYIINDSRLCLALRADAVNLGATVINYCSYVDNTTADGRLMRDELTGKNFSIRAARVIHAVGAAAQQCAASTKGSHLVLRRERFPVDACLGLQANDRRWVFCVPFSPETVLVGTTEIADDGTGHATEEEVQYLLDAINRNRDASVVPAPLTLEDVTYTWSGLRPLADASCPAKLNLLQSIVYRFIGKSSSGTTTSRDCKIIQDDQTGAISIVGGKLTMWADIGEHVALLISHGRLRDKSGARYTLDSRAGSAAERADGDAYFGHLVRQFGSGAFIVQERCLTHPLEDVPIVDSLHFRLAEVWYSVVYEQAESLEDVLVRRMDIALLDVENGKLCATSVARFMASLKGYDEQWERNQVRMYIQNVVHRAHAFKAAKK